MATHALGGGKPRDKKQWNAALNQWQEGQNQEFMQEYEDEQAEREAVRQKRLPKFDPENPKAYMNAMSDDSGDGMVGAMGGGGSNPDGAQITIVKLKNGLMKTRADTELLVSRWRDILTTIGIKAFPYVMSRDQVMINVQEGFRVPDIKMFALDQEESKYFEQGGKKYYPKGTAADPDDEEPAPFEEEEPPPVKPKPKPKEPDWPASPGQKKASDAKPPAATEPAVVVNGGWKSDWSSCVGCKRACGPIPAAVCNVERFEAGEMTEEKFREIRNRKPFIIVNGSLNMEPTHRSKWSRAALLQDYKKHIVELGNPISLYDGHAANGHSKTFANYLEIFDHFEEADSENLYLVDSKLGSGKPTDAWHLPGSPSPPTHVCRSLLLSGSAHGAVGPCRLQAVGRVPVRPRAGPDDLLPRLVCERPAVSHHWRGQLILLLPPPPPPLLLLLPLPLPPPPPPPLLPLLLLLLLLLPILAISFGAAAGAGGARGGSK